MKKIPIIFMILLGLVMPCVVQAAFADIAEGAIRDLPEGAIKDAGEEVAVAFKDALESVEGKGADAVAAVTKVFKDQLDQLKKLGDTLEKETPEAREALLDSFKSSAKNGADKIKELSKDSFSNDPLMLENRITNAGKDIKENFTKQLDTLAKDGKIPESEVSNIESSMEAAEHEEGTIAGAGGKPKPEEPSTPEQQLQDGASQLTREAEGLEKPHVEGEAPPATSPEGRVEDGTESGLSEGSFEDLEELAGKVKIAKEEIEGGFAKLGKMDSDLKAFGKQEEALTKETGLVKYEKPTPDKPGSIEFTKDAFEAPKKITKQQAQDTKSFMKDEKGNPVASKEIEKGDVFVKDNVVEVTIGKSILKFKPKDSDMLKEALEDPDKCTFTLSADGKLSFKSTDSDLVESVGTKLEGKVKQLEELKAQITDLKATRAETGNCILRGLRNVKNSAVKFGERVKQIFKEEKIKSLKKLGKIIKEKVVWLVDGIVKIVEMMMTGVFFGVPTMIYQTLMQEAAAKALYREITGIYQITPDLAVQIPASLISQATAGQAGFYLYVAVNAATAAPYGNDMGSTALENGSYYAVYQTNGQWGSTYATSPSAFGVWVNLNTGLIFMDGGVPYSEQTPFSYLMEPTGDATVESTHGAQTTLSVQQCTEQAYSEMQNRTSYGYSQSMVDAIDPVHIVKQSFATSVTPDSTIQKLFAPVESSSKVDNTTTKKSSKYAPKLLVKTLNYFRNGIQDVSGLLPAGKTAVPTITIRQFEGLGILNGLLGPQTSSDNIEKSVEMIMNLTGMQSSTDSKKSTNVVQTVIDAQAVLKQALSNSGATDYGDAVEAAVTNLENVSADLQIALSKISGVINPGLSPSLDVNASNIYLYETEDTPIVQFMKENRFSDMIPAKDYVVFLDTNLTIIPLFSTALITRADGVGVIDFDTSQINSKILGGYMVSLVTGLVYEYSAKGAGSLVSTIAGTPAATYVSGTVMPSLFATIALVLNSDDAQDLFNQVLSMANYATNLSYQGPVKKNGCLFEKMPLEVSGQSEVEASQESLANALNGITIPVQSTKHTASLFGAPVSSDTKKQWLDSLYLYKVSKIIEGSKQQAGVFGTDSNGNPLYDYVVSVVKIDGTPGMQIVPLGLSDATGAVTTSTAQMLVSLVTGQVYDANYCPLANAIASVVIERSDDFSPIIAKPGQTSQDSGQKYADGNEIYIAIVENLPLSTAFMPTFCNPYNIMFGSLKSSPDYAADYAAVAAAQEKVYNAAKVLANDLVKAEKPPYVQFVWDHIQKNPSQKIATEVFSKFGSMLGLTGEPAGTFENDIQSWLNANAAVIPLQQALRTKIQSLQSVLQPPYEPVKKALDQMVIMCPMYWMHYANFAYTTESSSLLPITYNGANGQAAAGPNGQAVSLAINWITNTASSAASPLKCSFAQAIPRATAVEIIKAYAGWQDQMNSTNGVARVMQAGPFQFSHNEQYNVYLTLPASNGPLSLSMGNFFYNMVPIASPTSLFALADLNSSIANSIHTSLNTNNNIGLTASLSLTDFTNVGHSFLEMLKENPVAIDLSTGDVWIPTPNTYSGNCYNNNLGNVANAQCNVCKIGTVDPEQALNLALKNQKSSITQLQTENPGLYSTLMNCQQIAIQKAQLALSTYFAGRLLSVCPEKITSNIIYPVGAHGTYVYAVDVTPKNYMQASDYWVATDGQGNVLGALTPQINTMVSLVTGNVYQMNVSGAQQTAQSTLQDFTAGVGEATIETPSSVFKKMLGGGAPFASVGSNNPPLFNRIESLNNVQNQNFIQSQFKTSNNMSILAPQLPLTALQAATPVSPLYSTLYQVSGKYYLAMPGTGNSPSYYYDFNAEMQDVNQSSGTPTYTSIPGDAKRGMYYLIEGTGSAAVATPTSTLTGYGCQAMRMKFGIKVEKNGTQTMGLPVYNPPLPMTDADKVLAPGASGDNMQCLTSPEKMPDSSKVTNTYTYYQYENTASESYLTRCYLNTNIPVYNKEAQAFSTVAEKRDYYVDLITGECYSPDGTPKLSDITVAYNFTSGTQPGIVANSALDFSNPLFVWGDLDMLGESLQMNMMYQDTKSDPVNGYNQYQVQQYSTSFTLYNGNTSTTYAYGLDANGARAITQNGKALSSKITMSQALINALNSGSSLVTKSYTMNVNGIVPIGSPAAGGTVTVTETYVAPKQYMISYTDGAGDSITDMFQAPVLSGAQPGASTNSYNNPPLDKTLQAQLMQAKPFCAQVFASCPYGKETVQSINTTIAGATTAKKELALGTTGITCGLLYQPATSPTFTLPSAGLLSAIFSGANPAGSTGSTNGQYFAFYDSYNNGDTSSAVVPNQGQYGTYVSVVSSMANNFFLGVLNSPFPGVYAGNFNVEFAADSSTTAQTTYGAPYLRIVPLTGTVPSDSSSTAFATPTSGTEYLYKYLYDTVPNATLAQLKSTLNVSGNIAGFMQLVSALDEGKLKGAVAFNPSVNAAAAAVITNQVSYGTPLNALTQEAKGRYVYKLACGSDGSGDADPNAPTNYLCQLFFPASSTSNPDTYIDIYNGIVFQTQTTATKQNLLYPIGISVSHDMRNGITKMIGGAVPAEGSTALTIQTPVAQKGASLLGQIVNRKVVGATQAANS